jgi:flagellar hook-associated protein 2
LGSAFVTATDQATRFGEGAISLNIQNIIENVSSLKTREQLATRRLDDRRLRLIEQYTRMEEAMSRLQSQSNSLISSVQGLQGRQR